MALLKDYHECMIRTYLVGNVTDERAQSETMST